MSNKLYIIGVGPGYGEWLHPAGRKLVEASDVIIGGKRNLELFSHLEKEKLVIGNNLEEVCACIRENIGHKRIAVLATGDPGLYSVTDFLKRKLEGIEMEVLPGISSLQYLCSRVGTHWDDIFITSLHGREQEDLARLVGQHCRTAVFTGGGHTPDMVCRQLAGLGLKDALVTVGENLSYPGERIVRGTLEEIGGMCFDSLTLMLVEHAGVEEPGEGWGYTTSGIPDDLFVRGEVPMTKEEVRAVSLAKLRLRENSTVYDIGAGTGSVSVECALRCRQGKVFAIDRDREAVELVSENARKFGLHNVKIIEGEAPAALKSLPEPDRVFIGGTGENMDEILEYIAGTGKAVRVVINSVTIETTYQALEGLENKDFKNIEVTGISVSRSRAAGRKHLMQALNPVYILCGEKGEV